MKKFAIFGFAALLFGAVACDKIDESENLPAYNPQLPVVAAESVEVTPGAAVSQGVDLTTAIDALNVAEVKGGESWPEGFIAVVPFMEISASESYDVTVPINTTMGENGAVYVNPEDWKDAHKLLYGGNPQTQKTYLRFAVNAVNGEQSVRMGGQDKFYGMMSVDVVPPANVLYVIGNASDWGWDTAANLVGAEDNEMYYSGFAYVNGEFKFTKEKNWDEGNWGAEGDVIEPDGPNITLPQVGLYWMTVDLEELTWENTYIESLGCVGAFNGWDAANNVKLTPNSTYTVWTGTVNFGDGGEWKINANSGWDISLGTNPNNLEVGGGSGNMTAEPGTYTITLDLSRIPYHVSMQKN